MKNSVRIKNMAGYLNFICDKDIPFEKIISDLRERLEIIEQKKNKILPCVIWFDNRQLSEREKLELSDTFKSYGIDNFRSIF